MPCRTLTNLPAPAKLNLFLHVVGKRADDYHLLESIFVLIDLFDRIDITATEDSVITREGDIVGDKEKDLCVRAALALRQATGCSEGAKIRVKKSIPSGAGMGGGSSDAATTLLALNRLWNLGLTNEELRRIGVTLGADVPFFLFGQSAFARGIGEVLTPVDIPASDWTVVMPDVPTSTRGIFSDPLLTRNTKSLTMSALSAELASEWPRLPGRNDLQAIVLRLNPAVADALEFLGVSARMTGSGSAVFAYAKNREESLRRLQDLPVNMVGFAVKTVARHPIFEQIGNYGKI